MIGGADKLLGIVAEGVIETDKFLNTVEDGFAVAGEVMKDFAYDNPLLMGILLFGSILIPGPQFGLL